MCNVCMQCNSLTSFSIIFYIILGGILILFWVVNVMVNVKKLKTNVNSERLLKVLRYPNSALKKFTRILTFLVETDSWYQSKILLSSIQRTEKYHISGIVNLTN